VARWVDAIVASPLAVIVLAKFRCGASQL